MITVRTLYPIAKDSLDHIQPLGTAADNHTSIGLMEEIVAYFEQRKVNVLDIGCSGGEMVIDFVRNGHTAVGIEGSDYSVVNQRANWPIYHKISLFTCDATKRYEIMNDEEPLQFDCIMAWEVLEHIKLEDMPIFFSNINRHLKPNGIFIASVSMHGLDPQHVTVLLEETWRKDVLPQYFGSIQPYPFKSWLRDDIRSSSFVFMGTKKWE